MFRTAFVIAVVFLIVPHLVAAESLWGKVKEGASNAADAVSETAVSVTKQETPAESRKRIDTMASKTLDRLFTEQKAANGLYEQSYGYAVFDTRQLTFKVSAGYGRGVAVEKDTGARTYMKMATGGVGLSFGLGGFASQLVFLFEQPEDFRKFIEKGYDAKAEASTLQGEERRELAARFTDGTAVFVLSDKGWKVAANVTGTKYWLDDDLN
jgi:lipid-binding SYLF domain-containing protein